MVFFCCCLVLLFLLLLVGSVLLGLMLSALLFWPAAGVVVVCFLCSGFWGCLGSAFCCCCLSLCSGFGAFIVLGLVLFGGRCCCSCGSSWVVSVQLLLLSLLSLLVVAGGFALLFLGAELGRFCVAAVLVYCGCLVAATVLGSLVLCFVLFCALHPCILAAGFLLQLVLAVVVGWGPLLAAFFGCNSGLCVGVPFPVAFAFWAQFFIVYYLVY